MTIVQPDGAQKAYLHAVTYLARDARAFEFRPLGETTLAPFTAGAHVDLILPNRIRRSYSLCNPQGETHRYVVGVKKASPSRGASSYLHEKLHVGTEISIAPPRNNFPLVEAAPHSVLIAGGIGITPIWGMVQRLNAIGASFELHYASRTRGDAAFLKDFEGLDADPSRLKLTFDHEPGGKMLDLPAIVAGAPPGAHFYACGPAPMLDAFERAVRDVPGGHAHLERFEGVKDAAGEQAEGFEVVLARSGLTLAVQPGRPILDALLDEGIDVPFSCMEGVGGSCKVGVLEGVPDHRDLVLTDEERASNKAIMVCCSGAKTVRLVLDL
jgi:tetrachlorobenzoquinone reductase